jgi:ankyrin repeat protein
MPSTTSDIFDAIAAGDLDRVRQLIAENPALARARDAQGLSAVTQARYHGEDDVVETLLGAETELDVFEAAAVGRLERVRELLDDDSALVTALSPDGFTPLHLAAFFGHPEIARLLVERGADTNVVARNPMRVMPLHSAAAARQLEIAELLVNHGADVNASQERGFTPLHEAAQNGDLELARLLLERGADREQETEDGRRAADFAAAGGHEEVLALLGNGEVG